MEKFNFEDFMGIVTLLMEEKIERSLIEDMRIILMDKVEKEIISEDKLSIFDWNIKEYQ